MFIQIAPKVKVFATDADVQFIRQHATESFRAKQLSPEDADRAKRLATRPYSLGRNLRQMSNML
jgi:hypothetical protein